MGKARGRAMEGRRRGGGTCAVKSQPGKPECPRTAQHRSYICWLATLRNMHDTRLTPPTTASTRLQVCLFWDKISQPNYHKTVTNRQFFFARFARETAGPDRPPARNSGVRPKKCPPEILLKHGPVSLFTGEIFSSVDMLSLSEEGRSCWRP